MKNERYELAVIGAGPAGLVAAKFAARLGAKVALIEGRRIGGDCTWTGCVPSKALLKAAKVAETVRRARDYGIVADPPAVDLAGVREYVRHAIDAAYRHETPEQLGAAGVELALGAARFVEPSGVAVGGRVVRAKRFIVATGARPRLPPIAGLNEVPFATYEDIFDNEVLPKRMIVVGAGPLGVEIAQAYERFGARVTLIGTGFLPMEDADVRAAMRRVFEREGIRFVAGRARAARREGDSIAVATEDEEVKAEQLFIAAGREPNVEGLGLEAAGVDYSSRGIPVDARLRTNVKHIYAAGDVLGERQYTHYAAWQAFRAVRNALLPGGASGIADLVPRVTYTDPEVAQAGFTEEAAVERFGPDAVVHRIDMDGVDRAICENDTSGTLKIVARRDGTILGATVVARRAGEVLGELMLAMQRGLKLGDLAGVMHAYPTYSSPVQQLAADFSVERFLRSGPGSLIRKLRR
ncbi:MAG TPA: FAD-dependent oxidoreductase [Gammaproteobacteria bacterium]|nr:FAD-dependent oxidoreductase [Gammaproteobacteria bacterium]